MLRLNLGCGRDLKDHKAGWVNCDFIAGPGVDMVVDLEKPLSHWGPNCVDEVYCSHVLEHIIYWEHTVMEIHRILKPGGRLTVKVPFGYDWGSGHVRAFFPQAFDHLIAGYDAHHHVADARGFQKNSGNEAGGYFRLIERKYHYTVPFRWHLGHYLHLWINPYGRVGLKRSQITWVLEKVGA